MTLQLLVSAVNKNIDELISTMKIKSDAVIINQCDHNGYDERSIDDRLIRFYEFAEKGVGLSRNNALLRADKDIVLFSDEDIVYDADYENKILQEFENHPEADMLLFNVRVCEERRTYYNKEFKKVGLMNCGRYPAYSFAIRREKLHKTGVTYSLLFGGGAKYSNGEDSLFIRDCIKKGMKVYTVPVEIGEEIPRPSTWFNGYNEKFFFDRGVLFHHLYGNMAWLWALRFVIVKKKVMCQEIPAGQAFKLIMDGVKEAKN